MLQNVVASPFYGLRGWMGCDVLLLTRNALYHRGQEALSAEPCGGVRHAIPTVECSRVAPLGRDST
ncbi:MAG: hypothetical protein QOF66_5180 [Mycobacterium sp.]|jgi:hypothetical protein|nr:hypothetical protein [Mycobacterium sp.]